MDDEVLCRDVYPAEVLAGDGSLMRNVRVFITSHRMIVWREDGNANIGIALEVRLAEPFSVVQCQAKLGHGENIEVATMKQGFIVNQGHGCGCKGKLKALGRPADWTRKVSA